MTARQRRRTPPAAPRRLVDPKCLCGKVVTCYDARTGRSHCWPCSLAEVPDRSGLVQLFIDRAGVARIDRDRMGGGVTCEECGCVLYDHPELPGDTYLTVLCDGSVTKL
jgi:hypothetical protein